MIMFREIGYELLKMVSAAGVFFKIRFWITSSTEEDDRDRRVPNLA